jgi:large subunit ribosomal protein L32e
MRLKMRGWPRTVRGGYKSKLAERGRHPSGLEEVIVARPADLEKVDSKTQIVRIMRTVGERKRVAIMERAQALELVVANPGTKKTEPATPTEELIVKEPEPGEGKKDAANEGKKE